MWLSTGRKNDIFHLLDKYYPEMIILEKICINFTNGGGTVILLVSLKGEVYS